MKLVVGLGNPGREYAGTRHNVGFEVLDRLAVKTGMISSPSDFDRVARSNFEGLALDGPVALGGGKQERFLLLKPLTYMNLSGRSVQAAKAFYQLSDDDLMIVLDDLALPCGKIRIRANGSTGGHNGLRDIERALGTSNYARLRVGIDPKPERVPQRDYVLTRFSEEQRKRVNPAIDRAADALLAWAEQGVVTAMNRFNADAESASDAKDKGSRENVEREDVK
jgi:peptidyl-tRNA hydrolase, PTH1 family